MRTSSPIQSGIFASFPNLSCRSLLKVEAPLPAFPEMRSPPDAAHIPDALSPARSDTHSCLSVLQLICITTTGPRTQTAGTAYVDSGWSHSAESEAESGWYLRTWANRNALRSSYRRPHFQEKIKLIIIVGMRPHLCHPAIAIIIKSKFRARHVLARWSNLLSNSFFMRRPFCNTSNSFTTKLARNRNFYNIANFSYNRLSAIMSLS